MAKKKNKTVSFHSSTSLGSRMTVVRLFGHGVGTANANLRTRKARFVLTHPSRFVEELTFSLGVFSVDAAPKG